MIVQLISVSRDWETVKNVFPGNSSSKPDQTGRVGKVAKQSKMLNNSLYSTLGNKTYCLSFYNKNISNIVITCSEVIFLIAPFIEIQMFNVKYLAMHVLKMHAGARNKSFYGFASVRAIIHSINLLDYLSILPHKQYILHLRL